MSAYGTDLRDESGSASARHRYNRMPLTQLAFDIFERSDPLAVREVHENRRVFGLRSGPCVLMTEFLLELRDCDLTFQWCGRDPVVVDQAYDLTLAKFHDLPSEVHACGPQGASDGPDCRYYYRAFHNHMTGEFEKRPPASVIEAEIRAAEAFQRLVARHFHLSCLECARRAAKLVRRYAWKVNAGPLVLWLPVEMSGSRCRRWLGENIPDPDPARPGERDRVQAIVDHLLARRRVLSLDQLKDAGGYRGAESVAEALPPAEEVSSVGLAGAVAEEKAENIDEQRPAIRRLGAIRLKELIRTIFESLAEDRYHAERIAADFGLSKASLSRFAGGQWRRDGGGTTANHIPDLWRNTAHVLAAHEDFVAVARRAGVWNRVRQVIVAVDGRKGEAE